MSRPRTPFRNQVRDRRYKAIIEAAAQHPYGTMHAIPLTFPDEATVRQHVWKIRSEARFQGYGVAANYGIAGDGTATLSFRIWDKETSQAYIAEQTAKGRPLRYNVRRNRSSVA